MVVVTVWSMTTEPQPQPTDQASPPSNGDHSAKADNFLKREALISLVSAYGVGSGRLVNRALDGPYKSYYPHTFGLKSADVSFGLANLIIVNY